MYHNNLPSSSQDFYRTKSPSSASTLSLMSDRRIAGPPYGTDQPMSWVPSAPYIPFAPLPTSPNPILSHRSTSSTSSIDTSPMHPVLRYDPTGRMLFNIANPFTSLQFRPEFAPTVMNDVATSTPVTCLYLNLPGYPRWAIQILNPTGITVRDILTNIYQFLHINVCKEEFSSFPIPMQSSASSAFNARTSRDSSERSRGLKRVDFLSPRTFFLGLTLAVDGHSWDIILSPTPSVA